MLQEIRFALRGWLRNPGFALAAVLTLGLGIGANTAIFGVLNAVTLQPLPYADPGGLVEIATRQPVTLQVLDAWRNQNQAFEAMSGYASDRVTLIGDGDPASVIAALVSDEHFGVLGRQPFLGRDFREDDHRPGAAVVILGYALWQQRYGGDPSIVGRRIGLRDPHGDRRTVIGVMPRAHRPLIGPTQLWLPHVHDRSKPEWHDMANLAVVGRLKPGGTVAAANADARRVGARLHAENPVYFRESQRDNVRVRSLHEAMVGGVRSTLWILQGSVGLVLLIACANVANLLLARSTTREGEMAMRTALGASRVRLVRQLLIEGLLLGCAGGAAGIGLAWVALSVARSHLTVPRATGVGIDLPVIVFATVFALLSSLIAGLIPAFRTIDGNIDRVLRRGSQTRVTSGGRLGTTIVCGEIALAVVVAAAAGLMMKSLWKVHQVPLGFEHQRLLTMSLAPPPSRYDDDEARRAYYREIRERVAALPGVVSSGTVNLLPMVNADLGLAYLPTGNGADGTSTSAYASYRAVSAGYFDTMGIPLVAGRAFDETDRSGSVEVGILNRRMAERLWPDEDPIGKQIRWDADNPWFTVVGVAENIRQRDREGAAFDVIYRPYAQEAFVQNLNLVVRAGQDAATLAPSVRNAIRAVDSEVPILHMRTMDRVISSSLASRRAITALMTAAASLALILGAVGVYGVTAYTVGRRTREIGIRLALGATPATVMKQIIRTQLSVAIVGLALGLVGAVGAARLLRGLLFQVDELDPGVLLVVCATLLLTAGLAGFVPAWRASRIDLLSAIRAD